MCQIFSTAQTPSSYICFDSSLAFSYVSKVLSSDTHYRGLNRSMLSQYVILWLHGAIDLHERRCFLHDVRNADRIVDDVPPENVKPPASVESHALQRAHLLI